MLDESPYRYTHINEALLLPVLLPVPVSPAAETALLGPEAESYAATRAHSEELVVQAAEELAGVPEVRSLAESLSLPASARLLFVGDSLTADWQSWRAILMALLARVRPEVKLRVTDVAIAGLTSIEGLCRAAVLPLSVRPHWMFVMLGSNDAVRFTSAPADRLLDLDCTRHALCGLSRWAVARGIPNDPIWLTPPPVATDANPAEALLLDDDDVSAVADVVRTMPGTIVDCGAAVGDVEERLLPDGLHLTLAAQRAIACAALAAWVRAAGA
jgi:lysophospholipase L1-like esterase